MEAAPRVAALIAKETNRDKAWEAKAVQEYNKVAERYVLK
jgi:hypothetical protein